MENNKLFEGMIEDALKAGYRKRLDDFVMAVLTGVCSNGLSINFSDMEIAIRVAETAISYVDKAVDEKFKQESK